MRTFDWRTERAALTDNSRRLITILQTTTLLALLAAAFTLATAISGRVLAQRRQIGLLRAIGLTPAGVTGVLVAYYLVLSALAAPLGLLAGAVVGDKLAGDFAETLGAPSAGAPGPGLLALSLLIALAVVAAATALPAWRAGRMPVHAALALGRGASSASASRVARIARRLHLPVVIGVGAKDAFAQRGRTVLTVASLALAAALAATAMGFEATMDRLAADPALRAQPFDLRLSAALPGGEVDRLLAQHRDVDAVARVREIVLTGRGKTEIHARVLDGPLDAFPYAIRDGRAARAAGEMTLGRGALDALEARIGQRVDLPRRRPHDLAADRRPARRARRRGPRCRHRALHVAGRRGEARRALLGRPALARRGRGADRGGVAARGPRPARGRAPDRVAPARGRRHAPGRLRHGRAADRDRGAEPADHARARRPRARARLRRARVGRRDPAPGAHDGDRRGRASSRCPPRWSGCRSAPGSSCS